MQVAIAKAGLQKAHETLIFERAGSNYTMADVVAADGPFKGGSFGTGCVTGDRSVSSRSVGISVPYEGKSLRKDSLLSEVRRWARNGSCEPSFAEGIGAAIRNEEEWFDLTGKIFVLVGATSEMGPLSFLLERGATVVALARPNSARKPNKWANVLKTAKLGCGKLFFPVTSGKESVVNRP